MSYDREEICFIQAEWYSLPALVKSDTLRMDVSGPTHAKYNLSEYRNFVGGSGEECYTTNKLRKLKRHLFGAAV